MKRIQLCFALVTVVILTHEAKAQKNCKEPDIIALAARPATACGANPHKLKGNVVQTGDSCTSSNLNYSTCKWWATWTEYGPCTHHLVCYKDWNWGTRNCVDGNVG